MGKVFINDLVVRGIIGVNDSERESPQEIVINLDLFTDLRRAGATDDIADCVDYQWWPRKSGLTPKAPGGSRSRRSRRTSR